MGQLVKRSFDAEGRVTLSYSNGDKTTPLTIAMVDFDDIRTLEVDAGTVFKASDTQSRVLGKAGEGRFKQLATSSIEMSNVDLSQEFADMLVIQRGYQASSRILNVANQMIEQLYENTRGR
ncbi:flagellar hook-basal body complex protein [Shewanella woodyi]|uniref:flagellar hook-basal body complex protein n=1 Tax=Shewanella woodyi TaxID=60961 RepID=UPI003749A762